MSDLCLVHLVWKPLGPSHLERFLTAYRTMPAGCEHRLVVVMNGFTGDELPDWRALLAGVDHEELVLEQSVQDIAAYQAAAARLRATYLCFCNSYSEPLVPGWLAMLREHASRDGIGLVGATGSWESHRTNLERFVSPSGFLRAGLSRLRGDGSPATTVGGAPSGQAKVSRSPLQKLAGYRQELARARADFDLFPSPHLRTNGFMVRRDLLLDLDCEPIREKYDALRFESGRRGLTRQVESRGLRAMVVGRDGRAFPPAEWWRCGAFRSGRQENLLISDNRTREFDALRPTERERVVLNTWGRTPEATERALALRVLRPVPATPAAPAAR